jgi:hypothetical protein
MIGSAGASGPDRSPVIAAGGLEVTISGLAAARRAA